MLCRAAFSGEFSASSKQLDLLGAFCELGRARLLVAHRVQLLLNAGTGGLVELQLADGELGTRAGEVEISMASRNSRASETKASRVLRSESVD